MNRIKHSLYLFVLAIAILSVSNTVQAQVGKLTYNEVKLNAKICTTQSSEYNYEWEEDWNGYFACWHGDQEIVSELIHFMDGQGNYSIAYADENNIYIDTISTEGVSNHKLTIAKQYPLFGDVICDENNNYYIVWGQWDEKCIGDCVTLSVAKYNEVGVYLGSCDVRTSTTNNGSETKTPFVCAGCDAVIVNGVLTASFGRAMYNGHQSNTTLSVNIENMELVNENACYVSHCYATRVMSLSTSEVLYGNLGDAYPRGFTFSKSGEKRVIPFHFYGESGDNYTYSQLGDMAEFGDNVFYCATSTKSMAANCEDESRNLFIQGINFEFANGTSRTGTCMGEPCTDTGIIWLTNYTNKHAKNPQIVKVNDSQAVIMWEVFDAEEDDCYLDTYYTIVSDKGEIIQGARSLNQHRLNTFEQPLFWNNAIYWVSCGYRDQSRQTFSDNAAVYRLSLEEDDTTVKKGSQIVIGNEIYKVTGKKSVTLSGFRDKQIVVDIQIPATVKYNDITYKVTEIGKGAFEKCTNLFSVRGGKYVKKIGDNAFANCKKLNGVIIGKKLTTIGKKAFYNCKKLDSITFKSKKLKKIGKKTFSGIYKKATIYVPASKADKYQKLFYKAGLKKNTRIRKEN